VPPLGNLSREASVSNDPLIFSPIVLVYSCNSPLAHHLLLVLLSLEVAVSTVGDSTTDEDDGVKTDTEAAIRGGSGRRGGLGVGLGLGVTGLVGVS
jgi:hypothetical protein